MPKVVPAPQSIGTVHNADQGGVRVTIQLRSRRERERITISLSGPCAWKGKLLELVQYFDTDNQGRVVVMLPPSEEIKALTPRNPVPGLYKLQAPSIGMLTFEVPNVPKWTLGE